MLLVPESDVAAVRSNVLATKDEKCAILFTNAVETRERTNLLVHEYCFPDSEWYSVRGPLNAELTPAYVAKITKYAARLGSGLVFVHSHPGDNPPAFSSIDDAGEKRLSAFLNKRHPGRHVALVISRGGMRARMLGTSHEIPIISLGAVRRVENPPSVGSLSTEKFDRQIRLLGTAAQQALSRLAIGIVGLGGLGSLVAQQLVHLGVTSFVLMDPDTLDTTNLNRVVGATPTDVGAPKVDIAQRYIAAMNPDASVVALTEDVMKVASARKLRTLDILFGCTDSHGSRAVLQQVAYQYLVPCIDMGAVIVSRQGSIQQIIGRIQLLSAGLPCLTCHELLNANQVRRDMMTAFERALDPYFAGEAEPAPAVMSLNSTIASLGVTMFLAVVAGFPSDARHLIYDAMRSRLRNVTREPNSTCYICSRVGALARGDTWNIFARAN
jgi:molybdopterin-synthase adenylyltransferase